MGASEKLHFYMYLSLYIALDFFTRTQKIKVRLMRKSVRKKRTNFLRVRDFENSA